MGAVGLDVATQIGIRETRRIHGLYTLTGEDVLRGARFDDAIARCSYPVDIHDPTGTRGQLIGLESAGYYEIPYRCLVPVRVDNLLVAGRCLSATHEGAASARVSPPVYAMGQAGRNGGRPLRARAPAAPRPGRHSPPGNASHAGRHRLGTRDEKSRSLGDRARSKRSR